MPLKQIDYSKGLIYTIIHVNDTSLNYVGSTTSFVDRKTKHKSRCKSSQIKLYVMIRDNGGWEMFVMKPYKLFPCNSSIELTIEEERCRLELKSTLNTLRCHLTEEQKKEYNNKKDKEYRMKHTEEKKEYDIIYNENHTEEKKEYNKNYNIRNADKISEKKKEKYTCQCGSVCRKSEKSRHELTNKHINFMENK
jgi:hypothetical protein